MTDEYDDDSPEAWQAWFPDIKAQIELGTFDSYLLPLATAIVLRVDSGETLKLITQTAIARAKKLGVIGEKRYVGKAEVPPVPVGAAAYAAGFSDPILGETLAPLLPTWQSSGTINTGSGRYLKVQLEGKTVRLDFKGSQENWFMDGLLANVKTCGPKFAQCRFSVDPTVKYPTSYKLKEFWKRQENNIDWAFRVPYSAMKHVFQNR